MKILAFPRDNNPYQELLYRPMRNLGNTVDYLEGPTGSHTLNLLLTPFMLVAKRLQGYRVFHLHWTYPFILPWAGKAGRWAMQVYFVAVILLVKLLGFKLVWTAHNALPHQRLFANDLWASRFLGRRASLVIAHSASAERQLQDLRIASYTVRIVPHGNYSEVYPNTIDRSTARKQLRVADDAFVVLFFGKIDPYKNVPALTSAIDELLPKYPKLHLVVAGSCRDPKLLNQVKSAKRKLGRHMQLKASFIKDREVQRYFVAADVAAMPFSEITTSGSAILALSFGVPIIAPRMGAIKDMPESVGFLYDPQDVNGLPKALVSAAKKKSLNAQRRAAKRYANSLSWPAIAQQTLELFEDA